MAALKLTYSVSPESDTAETIFLPGFEQLEDLEGVPTQLLAAFRACQQFTKHARQQAALEAIRQIQQNRIAAATHPVHVDPHEEECERWDGLS